MVAITVLCSIALGAVLTILRGPWLWGSLIALPVLSVAAIFLLFHIDDKKLRRSFQFAIILSLAAHLTVLLFASITNIFGNTYERPERQIAQRKVRTIEISDQRASFVWEDTNSRETPEPLVEPKKETQPTTVNTPQPIPVEETITEVTPSPQLTKRESPQKSVPRQNRELSKLRSQRAKLQPKSSQKMTGKAMEIATQPAPSAKPTVEVTKSSSRADAIAKSAPKQPQATNPSAAEAAPTTTQPEIKPTVAAAARRARESEKIAMSPPRPSPSSAKIRRSELKMPKESRSASPTETNVARATTTKPTAEPSKSAGKITRRSTESQRVEPGRVAAQRATLSPQTQVARAAERRSTKSTKPSISNAESVTTAPRRSTVEASVATSPIAIEQPARTAESKNTSRDVRAKTLSVSRNTDGVAGIGRAKNLDRFVGGEPTAATRASDSARRERTLSRPSEARMLTSSTRSETRRASGTIEMPTSAFKADTSAAAKIAGSNNPSERSLESSAAQINSASKSHRDETSAERGSSSVDLGPTKIVNDQQQSRRLSGGSQMEVARLSPDLTRRSRDQSNRQPTLAAAEGMAVAAPRNMSTTPAAAESIEASSEAVVASRAGGQATLSADRAAATLVGDNSDRGESDISRELADSRRRARSEAEESGRAEREDDEERNQNRTGRRESRIAQAPVTLSEPGFGIAKTDGVAKTESDARGEEASDSRDTELTRRSTSNEPGAGIAPAGDRAATDSAAASTSVENTSATRRNGNATATANTPDVDRAIVNNGNGRRQPTVRPMIDPGPMGMIDAESGTAAAGVAAKSPTLEARTIDVARIAKESREQVQGIDLKIAAIEGPAGLGDRPDDFIGVLARPASRDSEQIMPDLKSRFRNREFGGVPAMNPDAVVAKEAFSNRNPGSLARAADPTTEAAIQLGLEFLARYQSPDGSWALTGFDRESPQYLTQLDSDTAATGLAVLAFQGAGYNHREYKYARQLEKAINWLVENQAEDGGLYVPTDKKSNDACRLYSHGIAALALTEAYGMTQDPQLKKPAQKALDYIDATQDGRKGGWRYFVVPGKRSADTSVSGWMMMAMQSGRLAGLNVKTATFDGVDDWLDVAADPENESLYRYNPYLVDAKGVSRIQGRRPSAAMTSVGLLMRIYSGWKKDDPRLLAGADYLLKTQLPSDSTPQQRDTYYWYYATQVLKHVGGPHWDEWNNKLRPLLTRSQEKTGDMAGSWHPYKPVPDRWGSFGGRIYVTTMNLLSLEVRHRLLPLYQQSDNQPKLMGIIETGELIVMNEVGYSETTIQPPVINDDVVDPLVADATSSPGDADNRRFSSNDSDRPMLENAVVGQFSSPQDTSPAAKARGASGLDVTGVEIAKPTSPNSLDDVEAEVLSVAKGAKTRLADSDLGKDDARQKQSSFIEAPDATKRLAMTRSSSTGVALEIPAADLNTTAGLAELKPVPDTNAGFAIVIPSKRSAAPSRRIARALITAAPSAPAEKIAPKTYVSRRHMVLKPAVTEAALKIRASEFASNDAAGGSANLAAASMPSGTSDATESAFGSIRGRVILDGEILRDARVEFIPVKPNGKRMVARTNRLGQYSINSKNTRSGKGIASGEYQVSITTTKETPDLDIIDLLEIVPKKYNTKTTLKASIKPKITTSLDLKLETDGK